MNNRGNIMVNFLFFIMGLIVVIMFISPLKSFIGIAQESDNLNCVGYVTPDGNANSRLSYNSSLPTDSMTCFAFNLYLPYIVITFLIAGVVKLLYERSGFGIVDNSPGYGGG